LWIFFGINTFNSQIEALYFNDALQIRLSLIYALILTGFIQALIFAPVAVLILGKMKGPEELSPHPPTPWSAREWALKLILLSVIVYPVLYFLFGYYVAWQVPAVRLLYTGSDTILGFGAHMAHTLRNDPWLYPWQVLRGLIWIALAWPVIRMSKAPWWETGLIVGTLFAILMNAQHLIPNAYMPPAVRLAHFVETATSNFILGFVIVWVLHRHHSSIRDLFVFRPEDGRPERGAYA
jgi:hypothetical protein